MKDSARAVTSVAGDDCDVEWQPCLSGRDSGHERPGECACSSHDGVWPLGPHPCRVARYRLDVRNGVGALLIGSKPFSVLKARPPELKHSLLARPKGASVLRDCAPTLAVAAPAVVVVSNSRLSGTDAKPLTKRYIFRGSAPPTRAPHPVLAVGAPPALPAPRLALRARLRWRGRCAPGRGRCAPGRVQRA